MQVISWALLQKGQGKSRELDRTWRDENSLVPHRRADIYLAYAVGTACSLPG